MRRLCSWVAGAVVGGWFYTGVERKRKPKGLGGSLEYYFGGGNTNVGIRDRVWNNGMIES